MSNGINFAFRRDWEIGVFPFDQRHQLLTKFKHHSILRSVTSHAEYPYATRMFRSGTSICDRVPCTYIEDHSAERPPCSQ